MKSNQGEPSGSDDKNRTSGKKTETVLELAKNNEKEINNITKDYNEFKKECNPKHLNNLTERIKKLETQLQDHNKNDEVDQTNLRHSYRTKTMK